MQPFFPGAILDSARITVLSDQRVANPPFYRELMGMGFPPGVLPDFRLMGAITFVDTVVSHGPLANRTLFHELVHVVQYEKLVLVEFANKYVTGLLTGGSYEAIPLEVLERQHLASILGPQMEKMENEFVKTAVGVRANKSRAKCDRETYMLGWSVSTRIARLLVTELFVEEPSRSFETAPQAILKYWILLSVVDVFRNCSANHLRNGQ